ncbi:integrase arm-type DNA-binding domain-containing protein [Sphingomonas sp.]|uniref:integrase arm-type DNA-binding domain-containing protein n=1 Tax=Sphingomonas sp. TaxID=28214 RepID=UPI0035BC4FD4
MTGLSLKAIAAAELARVGLSPPDPIAERARRIEFATDLSGFGVRHHATGRSSYIVQTRMGGRMRTVTIGFTAVVGWRVARDVARRILLRAQTKTDPAADRPRSRRPHLVRIHHRVLDAARARLETQHAHGAGSLRRLHLDGAFPGSSSTR